MIPNVRSVEEQIQDAIERGEFSNLPGRGRPLDLAEDAFIPAEMRMAYRILKRAGFVPEEVLLQKEVSTLRFELVENHGLSDDERRALKHRLWLLENETNVRLERFRKAYSGT